MKFLYINFTDVHKKANSKAMSKIPILVRKIFMKLYKKCSSFEIRTFLSQIFVFLMYKHFQEKNAVYVKIHLSCRDL